MERSTGYSGLVRPVLELNLLLPLIAGALVSSWRRRRADGIPGGVVAGATILGIDCLLVLAYGLMPKRFSDLSGFKAEILLEGLAFVTASGAIGSLLGFTGASASVLLARVIGRGGGRGPASRERQETL